MLSFNSALGESAHRQFLALQRELLPQGQLRPEDLSLALDQLHARTSVFGDQVFQG